MPKFILSQTKNMPKFKNIPEAAKNSGAQFRKEGLSETEREFRKETREDSAERLRSKLANDLAKDLSEYNFSSETIRGLIESARKNKADIGPAIEAGFEAQVGEGNFIQARKILKLVEETGVAVKIKPSRLCSALDEAYAKKMRGEIKYRQGRGGRNLSAESYLTKQFRDFAKELGVEEQFNKSQREIMKSIEEEDRMAKLRADIDRPAKPFKEKSKIV